MQNKPMRRQRLLSLNVEVENLVKQAIGRRSFVSAGLISYWRDIVGAEDARNCLPLALKFPPGKQREGQLTIQCRAGFALELQHRQIEFLARINGYFGYRAVDKIRIVQGAIAAPTPRRRTPKPLSADDEAKIQSEIAQMDNPALKTSLFRFGAALLSAKKRRNRR